MEAGDSFVFPQYICDFDQLQDGDSVFGSEFHQERGHDDLYQLKGCLHFKIESVFGSGLHQEGGCDVLYQFKVCILPDSCPTGFSTLPLDYFERGDFPVHHCALSFPKPPRSSPGYLLGS